MIPAGSMIYQRIVVTTVRNVLRIGSVHSALMAIISTGIKFVSATVTFLVSLVGGRATYVRAVLEGDCVPTAPEGSMKMMGAILVLLTTAHIVLMGRRLAISVQRVLSIQWRNVPCALQAAGLLIGRLLYCL